MNQFKKGIHSFAREKRNRSFSLKSFFKQVNHWKIILPFSRTDGQGWSKIMLKKWSRIAYHV